MALSLDDVRHVATLARLHLDDAELERMQQQLSAILEYMTALQAVDVSGVEPTAQVTDVVNVLRPDVVRPSLSVDAALSGAARRAGDYFKVKPVFEE